MPDVDDKTFEQSMAEMALAALKSKAPALSEYLMGFQLIEKNEDDTRAVGFFGFKVGDRWVYGPVFFLAGELKGLDLMYAKQEDKFMPLEEGWVSYLTKKRNLSLGSTQHKDKSRLAISGPDLRPYHRPPNTKISQDEQWLVDRVASQIRLGVEPAEWAKEAYEALKDVRPTSYPERLRLPKLAADLGITRGLLQDMRDRPALGQAILRVYPAEKFAQELRNARRPTQAKAASDRKPLILNDSSLEKDRGRAKYLTDDQKKKILRGNTVVVDDRPEEAKTKVYKYETTLKLENPKQGGMYDMLTSDGGMRRVMILVPRVIGHGSTRDVRLVIDPKDGLYTLRPTTSIYVSHQYEDQEFKDALADIGSDVSSDAFTDRHGDMIDRVSDDDGQVVIFQNGECLTPVQVHQKFENQNGTSSLLVKPVYLTLENYDQVGSGIRMRGPDNARARRKDGPIQDRLAFDGVLNQDNGLLDMGEDGRTEGHGHGGGWSNECRQRLILTDKPIRRAIANGSSLLIPRNAHARVLSVKPASNELDPGTTADLFLGIEKQASQLKVYQDGLSLHITSDVGTKVARNECEALEVLIGDLGMGEKDARVIHQEAKQLARASTARYWYREKLAFPMDSIFNTGRSDPTLDAQVQESLGPTEMQLPEYQSKTDPEAYRHTKGENDYHAVYQKDIEQINRAAASGQNDVFDASALGALIKVHNPDEEIDGYLSDMIQALDKMGRTLFLLYWHNEELQERYGKGALSDLEDNVKSTFQSLGEVILDLKKRSPTDVEAFGRGLLSVGGN